MKLRAIEGAYIALDVIKTAEARRKRCFAEIDKLARMIDPDNPRSVVDRLADLHRRKIPLDKAQEHVLGVEMQIANFRKKLQRADRERADGMLRRVDQLHPEIPPFARTRAAASSAQKQEASRALGELVPCDPDSDFSVQRPEPRSRAD